MITDPTATLFSQTFASHAATITGISGLVYGYYKRELVDIDIGQVPVSEYRPVFNCSTDAVTSVTRGTRLQIGGVSGLFKVVEVEIIDAIETRLILEIS